MNALGLALAVAAAGTGSPPPTRGTLQRQTDAEKTAARERVLAGEVKVKEACTVMTDVITTFLEKEQAKAGAKVSAGAIQKALVKYLHEHSAEVTEAALVKGMDIVNNVVKREASTAVKVRNMLNTLPDVNS